jgi:hypothetical protein
MRRCSKSGLTTKLSCGQAAQRIGRQLQRLVKRVGCQLQRLVMWRGAKLLLHPGAVSPFLILGYVITQHRPVRS